jgi:hypothetical protein
MGNPSVLGEYCVLSRRTPPAYNQYAFVVLLLAALSSPQT